MRRIASVLSVVPVLLFSLAILFLACCTPQWSPDSRGFAYSKLNGAIYYFDLGENQEREIVPGAGSPGVMHSVAFSTDGKKIAIARLLKKADSRFVRFEIHNLSGGLVQQSDEFALGPVNKKAFATLSFCHWSSDGKRLLAQLSAIEHCISYDINANKIQLHKQVQPLLLPSNPAALSTFSFAASPIIPDGSAFIALADQKLVLQRWKGEPIEMQIDEIDTKQPTSSDTAVQIPPIWRDGKLRLSTGSSLIEIDPTERKATQKKDDPDFKRLMEHAKENKVRVLAELKNGSILQVDNKQLQLWNSETEVTSAIGNAGKENAGLAFPAPNGKAVLFYDISETPQILAIDDQGKVLTKINFFVPPTR